MKAMFLFFSPELGFCAVMSRNRVCLYTGFLNLGLWALVCRMLSV
jgi:hypothetical protein